MQRSFIVHGECIRETLPLVEHVQADASMESRAADPSELPQRLVLHDHEDVADQSEGELSITAISDFSSL